MNAKSRKADFHKPTTGCRLCALKRLRTNPQTSLLPGFIPGFPDEELERLWSCEPSATSFVFGLLDFHVFARLVARMDVCRLSANEPQPGCRA